MSRKRNESNSGASTDEGRVHWQRRASGGSARNAPRSYEKKRMHQRSIKRRKARDEPPRYGLEPRLHQKISKRDRRFLGEAFTMKRKTEPGTQRSLGPMLEGGVGKKGRKDDPDGVSETLSGAANDKMENGIRGWTIRFEGPFDRKDKSRLKRRLPYLGKIFLRSIEKKEREQ